MTVEKITDTQKPEGPFVLMTFDGEGFLFDERHQVVIINGKPKQRDVKRNYFESDLGEGKAKYWTLDINEAHKFDTIDEATIQLCKLNRPHLIKVRKLSREDQECRSANPVLIPGHPVLIPAQSQALRDVAAERQRQQSTKGYSTQQDDTYIGGELAAAAISYIEPMEAESYWPADWHDDSFKPSDYRRNLVKAGALILAEIERIDRQEQSPHEQ
ncbi:Phage EaD protein [Enterobacter cloacae]|nr:Phage EaD protein [Enterobacter cloacae]